MAATSNAGSSHQNVFGNEPCQAETLKQIASQVHSTFNWLRQGFERLICIFDKLDGGLSHQDDIERTLLTNFFQEGVNHHHRLNRFLLRLVFELAKLAILKFMNS